MSAHGEHEPTALKAGNRTGARDVGPGDLPDTTAAAFRPDPVSVAERRGPQSGSTDSIEVISIGRSRRDV
jgi:hypothetical protein